MSLYSILVLELKGLGQILSKLTVAVEIASSGLDDAPILILNPLCPSAILPAMYFPLGEMASAHFSVAEPKFNPNV